MDKNNFLLVKLNPNFQKEIFNRVVHRYGGSIKAGKFLAIPASSIRAYKNLYFKSVSKKLLNRLQTLNIIKLKELKQNTVLIFTKKDQIKKNLNFGREKRIETLKKWKKEIPKINEIFDGNSLNFEKWFLSYYKLINFGSRRFNYIKSRKNHIKISYITNSNKIKKEFVLKFPKKICVDKEFLYFFGLWCGDRAGGKRFGIFNQEKNIINFTEKFLKKVYQNPEKVLYIGLKTKEPKIEYHKKVIINSEETGWALSVHVTNGIFSSFFYYLLNNLEMFFRISNLNHAFFSGLFDAEGNVSLYNKSLRWACKDERLIKIYLKYLKKLGFPVKYDGACLISYDISKFYGEILPYMKHENKIQRLKFLLNGKGILPREYVSILKFIETNPKRTAKGIAKGLKKNKVYSELKLLKDFCFICSEGYPNKYKINNKGLNTLGV